MQVVQTKVRQGNKEMITWLPIDKQVKPGSILTLEKEDGLWEVIEQFSKTELSNINRGWNNNI